MMIVVLVLLIIAALADSVRKLINSKGIPGPFPLPLIGNGLEFIGRNQMNIVTMLAEVTRKYGRIFRYWLGPHMIVMVSDPTILQTVLKNNIYINKGFQYQFFNDYLQGVFTSNGDYWKQMRKLINPTFLSDKMKSFTDTFNEKAIILCGVSENYAGKGTFNVQKCIQNCILDISLFTTMGVNMNTQTRSDITYFEDIEIVTKATMERITKFWLYFDFIFERTEIYKKKKQGIRNMIDFLATVIKKRRRMIKEEGLSRKDEEYISYLDESIKYAEDVSLPDDKLALVVNDFLIAAVDTTSVGIAHTLLMLGMHPDIQEKAYRELKEIFDDSDRPVTMEDLRSMKEIEMIVRETLRITCPPTLIRSVDRTVESDGVTIPKGSSLVIFNYKLHRDPKYWSHPDEFYPDHFLPENIQKRPPGAYIPFSSGPRLCPGNQYAINVMKTVLSWILRKYQVKTNVNMSDINLQMSFMLEVINGYHIELHKRNLSD